MIVVLRQGIPGTLMAVLVTALVLTAAAFAAGPGGGSGQGSGGSGSGGSGGSGGGGGETTGSLYSDLYVALRAENGTPILKAYSVPADDPLDPPTVETCVQPVSYERVPGVTPTTNPVDGRQVWVIPLQGEWLTAPPEGGAPAELEACDPQPAYAMFTKEVDLERLNLSRTADDVLARKTADVAAKLEGGTAIGLDPAGRIEIDGVPIDAAPEAAAIYRSILTTGTIPGLPTGSAGPPAVVGPASSEGFNSRFDAWELAAAALGTIASKETPITIDTVLYYNRIIGFPPADFQPPAGWSVDFARSLDPATGQEATTGEQFVDLGDFTYSRAATFPGSVTWFDADTLTWKVSPILEKVPFIDLPGGDPVDGRTLTGIQAFAQMADDVRSVILFLHANEVIPGFFMDRVGTDTTPVQLRSITDPRVSWATLPSDVFQTEPFSASATLSNPWGGTPIEQGRVRVTIHAPAALQAADVSATSGGQPVPFTPNANGDLVGWWGPAEGFPIDKGYKVTSPFDVTIGDDAPVGDYTVELELVDLADPGIALATAEGTLAVHDNVPTVLWGGTVPRLATQGTAVALPVRVYAPAADENGALQLSVTAPGEALEAGDATVYGEAATTAGTDMVKMPLTVDAGGLAGDWPVALSTGYTDVVWYLTVAAGAPEGVYHLEVGLPGDANVVEADLDVGASESNGQKPPDVGEDTTAPTVEVEADGELGASATFLLSTETAETGVTFECQLTTGDEAGAWTDCTSTDGRASYGDLEPGSYVFAARATDEQGNTSGVVRIAWTVKAPQAGPSPSSPPASTPSPKAPGTSPQKTPRKTPQKAPRKASVSNAFTLGSTVAYRNAITTLTVKLPGRGILRAAQAAPAHVRSRVTHRLTRKRFPHVVKPMRVRVHERGKVALPLRATLAGNKVLRRHGAFVARVRLVFTPTGGKPRTVIARVTLKRLVAHHARR